jgi:hypothetical protein
MPEKDPSPRVAAIVHRRTSTGCEAAIVTYVWPDGTVNLAAFSLHGEARPHLRLPQGDEDGAWHWPEES